MILAGPDGDVTLLWRAGESGARHLAPATYRLRTTRVERTTQGRHWFLSSTGIAERELALTTSETTRIEVPTTVRFKGHAFRKQGQLRLGMSITTEDGRGLSIYAAGKRVPVSYRVLAKDGRELASGKMTYG